jgi:hypothetical protein
MSCRPRRLMDGYRQEAVRLHAVPRRFDDVPLRDHRAGESRQPGDHGRRCYPSFTEGRIAVSVVVAIREQRTTRSRALSSSRVHPRNHRRSGQSTLFKRRWRAARPRATSLATSLQDAAAPTCACARCRSQQRALRRSRTRPNARPMRPRWEQQAAPSRPPARRPPRRQPPKGVRSAPQDALSARSRTRQVPVTAAIRAADARAERDRTG